MPVRLIPEEGDVIVREAHHNGTLIYVLHTAPGAGQFLVRTRPAAVEKAVAFARHAGVRAWLADERDACVLLEDFRRVESR